MKLTKWLIGLLAVFGMVFFVACSDDSGDGGGGDNPTTTNPLKGVWWGNEEVVYYSDNIPNFGNRKAEFKITGTWARRQAEMVVGNAINNWTLNFDGGSIHIERRNDVLILNGNNNEHFLFVDGNNTNTITGLWIVEPYDNNPTGNKAILLSRVISANPHNKIDVFFGTVTDLRMYEFSSAGRVTFSKGSIIEEGFTIIYDQHYRDNLLTWTTTNRRFYSVSQSATPYEFNVTFQPFPGGGGGTHTHNWGNWTTITPAGCNNEGVEEGTCSICGEKQRRPIPKLDCPNIDPAIIGSYKGAWSDNSNNSWNAGFSFEANGTGTYWSGYADANNNWIWVNVDNFSFTFKTDNGSLTINSSHGNFTGSYSSSEININMRGSNIRALRE